MKYRLNKLDVKTTNNFKINDVEVDLELPKKYSFNDYYVDGVVLDKKIINKKIDSRIGLSFKKYAELIIDVDDGSDTLIINYDFLSNNLIDKIEINYKDGVSRNIILKYNSLEKIFHHLFLKIKGGVNSSGNITIINNIEKSSNNFMAIDVSTSEGANIVTNIIDLFGNVRVNNYYSEIHDNSNCSLNNIYIGSSNDLIDMNYYMKNMGKNSISDIKVEGLLDDDSIKNFRGTIDFVSGCVNSIGSEYENNILLTDSCLSRSLPQMLCGEESVVGNHGVSSGNISKEKLFYLESRGLSLKEAEKLIVMANFNKIIELIPDSDTRDFVVELVDSLIK